MVVIATEPAKRRPSDTAREPKNEFAEIARFTDAQVVSFTSGHKRFGRWFNFLFGKRRALGAALHAALLAGKFDAIYTTGEDIGLPLAVFLKMRGWRGRLVCVFHNVTPKKRLILRLVGARAFHRIVTVSQRQRDLLAALGFRPDSLLNVRNWVDTDFFSPDPEPKDDGYVMACGAENRDYATLAAAARLTNWPIRVYGQGFLTNDSASSVDLPPNLIVCPRVPYVALRDAYAGAAAVVLPLNAVDYAAGVTGLVEAMSMRKLVIVTRTDGISEYLDAARPGIEVAPGDAEALAAALNQFMLGSAARDAQARSNRAWAATNCSVEAYARTIAEALHGVHDQPGLRAASTMPE